MSLTQKAPKVPPGRRCDDLFIDASLHAAYTYQNNDVFNWSQLSCLGFCKGVLLFITSCGGGDGGFGVDGFCGVGAGVCLGVTLGIDFGFGGFGVTISS